MKPDSFQAKILNNRYLPWPFRFVIILFVNWVFHGFIYMDRTEKIFFLLLDGIFFLPIFFAFLALSNLSSSIILAVVITHTLHWLFNGHLYVLLKNLRLSKIELDCFAKYLSELRERAKREKSILAIAAFGSLSRGQLSESSDLDIRIIRRLGVINGIRACIFTFLERGRALLSKIPLDVYTLDGFQNLSKLCPDEPPVVLYDPQETLTKG